ncbi:MULTISPECIES: FxsA family protein [Paenibacillus]|uniref:FxsA family protein n=1 Tax=Paenibacillus TaxID=44249 RepID=UPI00038F6A27|nr:MULTISPECIES: FxsA family protein [Paenibacillus]CDN45090.1 hypothetical protein BN871_GK_00040 [Paenibacillus sp. P22]
MNKARQWGFMQKFMLGIAAYIVAEVIVIMLVSRWIGGAGVVLLMAGTAVLGGVLARTRGRKAWEEMRLRMGRGEPPGHALLDGLCILGGGLLLVLPGFIGDIVGLTMLLPFTRGFYRARLYRLLERLFRGGGGGKFFIIGR